MANETAIINELRRRCKTPAAVMRQLGLDERLLEKNDRDEPGDKRIDDRRRLGDRRMDDKKLDDRRFDESDDDDVSERVTDCLKFIASKLSPEDWSELQEILKLSEDHDDEEEETSDGLRRVGARPGGGQLRDKKTAMDRAFAFDRALTRSEVRRSIAPNYAPGLANI